jgi:ribosome maturation factor RimP
MTDIDRTALESVVEPVCKAHGVELVDVQWAVDQGGAVLRVLIDRERADLATAEIPVGSGVSLEDCKAVSRDLSTALDVHERVVPSGRYRLEVSSPGLDRPLVKRAHFERFVGTEVKVQTRVPFDPDGRRKVQGVLRGIEGDAVHVESGGKVFAIPLADVAKANVVYRFQ